MTNHFLTNFGLGKNERFAHVLALETIPPLHCSPLIVSSSPRQKLKRFQLSVEILSSQAIPSLWNGKIRFALMMSYTPKQGQYLAFIYYYTKLHRRAPAEADIQAYFCTTPPSVHQMILTLEEKGFISRTPGLARSIQLLVERKNLPDLD